MSIHLTSHIGRADSHGLSRAELSSSLLVLGVLLRDIVFMLKIFPITSTQVVVFYKSATMIRWIGVSGVRRVVDGSTGGAILFIRLHHAAHGEWGRVVFD